MFVALVGIARLIGTNVYACLNGTAIITTSSLARQLRDPVSRTWDGRTCGETNNVITIITNIDEGTKWSCPVKCVNGGSLREEARLRAQASRTRAASVSDRVTASLAIDCM